MKKIITVAYVAWAWLVSMAWLYGTRDNMVRSFKEKQA